MKIEKHNPKDIPITKKGYISERQVLLKIKKHSGFPAISEACFDRRGDSWYIVGIGDVPIELVKWWTEIPEGLK
jgi:hypothetical protein